MAQLLTEILECFHKKVIT